MKTVGIIGIRGKYGQFLERLFIDFGCTVIGSDSRISQDIDLQNRDIVNRSDIVVFSVPPREVCAVIEKLVPYSRFDQLWMDVTSIKVAPIQSMLKSNAEVVGLHPMCAPTAKSLRGQVVVVCPMRLNDWSDWTNRFLVWSGASSKICSPTRHDRAMAIIHGLIHSMQLTMAATMQSLGEDINESLSFASPVYKIALSLIGRILKQDPNLYADIQMLNPHVPHVLSQAQNELSKFTETVTEGNREKFLEQFVLSREHFGEDVLDEAYGLFEELSQLLSDRSNKHQVTLNIVDDRPGLLAAITGIFAGVGVNLSNIHSFKTMDGVRFLVGLDRSSDSPMVGQAIDEMVSRGLVKAAG